MTVSATTTTKSYTGDGSTTSFPTTFAFQGTGSAAELTVVQRTIATGAETTLSYSTHFTVTGGNGSTGTVVAASAPADTVQWHIRRNTTTTQTSNYVTNDPFPADTLEGDIDRLAMAGQERDGDISQTFKFPDTYTGGASTTMPEPVANAYLLFNADGDAITTSTTAVGQYLGGDGTVSLPFYSFSSDANSGFYRIGSDNVGLSLGGTKRVDFGAATTAFTGQVTATGFTGTLDGILGSGTPAAATVASLTSGGNIVSDTDSTDDLGTNSVRWANLYVDAVTTTNNTTIGGDLVITGSLTVNGSTVTNDATNTEVKDPLIELNSGAGSNANDLGIIMERGSTGDNAFMGWDESGDHFAFGTTTATASSTGNISYTSADLVLGTVTAEGDTSAGDKATMGYTAAEGLILTGQGSSYDFVLKNDADGDVARVATGTTVLEIPGSIKLATGATVTGILDEDDMSTNSATQIATQQSIKAYVDSSSKAPGISMTWESDTTDSDAGNGKVWANHATLSSATVLYFDDVENNGVSINDLIDSLDDPTASNSAMIYIQEAGTGSAGAVFAVSGAVTDASGYSKVAVTHKATFGTLADGDTVGVVFAFSGDNGSLSDPMSTRGDIIVRNSSNATARLGVGSANTVLKSDGTDVSYAQVSGAMIANDAIDSQHYADGSIDTAHIGAAQITGPKLGGGVIPADTGFSATTKSLGTVASGSVTLDEANGNFQSITGNGAFTLNPQTNPSTIVIQLTNSSSASTITVSNYDTVTGDDLTTTNGDDFLLFSTVIGSFQNLNVVALQ